MSRCHPTAVNQSVNLAQASSQFRHISNKEGEKIFAAGSCHFSALAFKLDYKLKNSYKHLQFYSKRILLTLEFAVFVLGFACIDLLYE